MATHFNILAWEIPQTEDPGGLHTAHAVVNVGHDLVTKQAKNDTCDFRWEKKAQKRPSLPNLS